MAKHTLIQVEKFSQYFSYYISYLPRLVACLSEYLSGVQQTTRVLQTYDKGLIEIFNQDGR